MIRSIPSRAYPFYRDQTQNTQTLSISMSEKRVCRFFDSPSGCKRGAHCSFEHVREPRLGGRGDISSNSMSGWTIEDVPRGCCRFFWNLGQCKHGFNCRFRHDSRPTASNSVLSGTAEAPVSSSVATSNAQNIKDRIAPYLTDSGLSKIYGFKTDIFFAEADIKNLSPVETHNYLRLFLTDQYRFHTTTQMYGFLRLFKNASTENKLWVRPFFFYVFVISFEYDRNWRMVRYLLRK